MFRGVRSLAPTHRSVRAIPRRRYAKRQGPPSDINPAKVLEDMDPTEIYGDDGEVDDDTVEMDDIRAVREGKSAKKRKPMSIDIDKLKQDLAAMENMTPEAYASKKKRSGKQSKLGPIGIRFKEREEIKEEDLISKEEALSLLDELLAELKRSGNKEDIATWEEAAELIDLRKKPAK